MTTRLLRSMPALTADPELGADPLLEEPVKQTEDGLPGFRSWQGSALRSIGTIAGQPSGLKAVSRNGLPRN